mmetsp:Transcript_38229/g.46642  ORF Transcript_38229/g.46642 Transcript_38229/m.46642 type:complete len:364 (-) Transcript_38229:68-1159(-)|eukprot:CAMPEP_0172496980 /NCGR_PEP_ID=MMETSP1066-20121228/94727_1 /TAXON_ID=671091 /ORGANISM="Coscinodiscus wailesii, Strain CCMP2513" /LENGTH=363 /DNA_ID=CAMNT_0013269547 /DNA_START=161 /DNA_END=1252 /DNA_ORIENTATION=-
MSSSSSTSTAAIPWVELYRPKKLSSVSHQTQIVQTLTNAISTNRLPHLLLYGPPGTGKTSVALALCRQLYPLADLKKRVLELNASDERGISVVRDKIKHFASLAVGKRGDSSNGANGEHYPNPPFKVIILDEADTVTPDAQAALRRIIEAHSKITRFILICNYVTRIIEPLASRCAKFRFQALPPASMKDRLVEIATHETCQFENEEKRDEAIDEILCLSQGDMRRAITTLQSAHALGGIIRPSSIAEMAGLPPQSIVVSLVRSLKKKTGTFAEMRSAVMDVIAEGYSVPTILSKLMDELILKQEQPEQDQLHLDEMGRALLSIKMAEVDKNLVDGADEVLQLLTVCSTAMRCLQAANKNRMD